MYFVQTLPIFEQHPFLSKLAVSAYIPILSSTIVWEKNVVIFLLSCCIGTRNGYQRMLAKQESCVGTISGGISRNVGRYIREASLMRDVCAGKFTK